ncbi:MAG: gfo/Idh/MocA family oxidoreductase, partial [Parasporobacterium sp.]|nr:gfo/Idh/MocA family oxidoreductase [Parasporobacterium sp.]
MKIGIVGTGMIVHEILPVLYKMPEIELHLICGTKRSEGTVKELADEYKINASFTDFDLMLSSKESKELDA